MASYKDIQGFNIQNLTADPDNAGAVGQIYYNSTTGSFKAVEAGGIPVGTWASGGAFPVPTVERQAGAGTQTAAVSVAGYNPATPGAFNGVYEYNGTAWSTNPNSYPLSVYGLWGSGTATAGLFVGGTPPVTGTANKFDGTTFTSTGSLGTARSYLASAGTQTATIAFGGTPGALTNAELFDGSTWSPVTGLNTGRHSMSGTGTSTAALSIGGNTGGSVAANNELWNGTSWTEIAELNTPRQIGGSSGISTYGITYAGEIGPGTPQAKTEFYDGSTWTEVADLSIARYAVGSLGGSAPADSTVTWTGSSGSGTSTEEWNAPDVVIKTLTTS